MRMNAIQARTIGTKRNRNGTLIKTKQQTIETIKTIKSKTNNENQNNPKQRNPKQCNSVQKQSSLFLSCLPMSSTATVDSKTQMHHKLMALTITVLRRPVKKTTMEIIGILKAQILAVKKLLARTVRLVVRAVIQ